MNPCLPSPLPGNHFNLDAKQFQNFHMHYDKTSGTWRFNIWNFRESLDRSNSPVLKLQRIFRRIWKYRFSFFYLERLEVPTLPFSLYQNERCNFWSKEFSISYVNTFRKGFLFLWTKGEANLKCLCFPRMKALIPDKLYWINCVPGKSFGITFQTHRMKPAQFYSLVAEFSIT